MDKRIQQGLEILRKEIEKDSLEIETSKKRMIDEIKSLDKNKMFQPKPKKKVSIIDKVLKILGHGKKR
jgi:hypothetical protein